MQKFEYKIISGFKKTIEALINKWVKDGWTLDKFFYSGEYDESYDSTTEMTQYTALLKKMV